MGKQSKKKHNFLTTAHQTLRKKGVVTTVYLVLRLLVILVMVAQFFNGNFENVFLCILTLILLLLPTVLERRLQIDLPNTLEIIIMLFIFAAEILGEIQAYYTAFPYWDTMLHTLNGFLCAAIGFSLVDLCNRHERFSLSLSPVFMAIVAFCFSMTIGVLWEFFECAMDQFFLLDMQKDTVINSISSVLLDPTGRQRPFAIHDITDLIVVANGEQIPLGLGGYLDIGHERPAGQLHRCGGVLLPGLFLCEKSRKGPLHPELHSPGPVLPRPRRGGSGRRGGPERRRGAGFL